MEKQFLKYFEYFTDLKYKTSEKLFESVKQNKLHIYQAIDLVMLKNNINNKCITITYVQNKMKDKEIDLPFFNFCINNKNDPFMVEKEYETIFYNPKIISEKQVKSLLYKYWLKLTEKNKIELGKKLGYLHPEKMFGYFEEEPYLDSKNFVKNPYKNYKNEFIFSFVQNINVFKKNIMNKIYRSIHEWNKILRKINPSLHIGQVKIQTYCN